MTIEESADQFYQQHKDEAWFVAVGIGKGVLHVYYKQARRNKTVIALADSLYPVEWHKTSGKARAFQSLPLA